MKSSTNSSAPNSDYATGGLVDPSKQTVFIGEGGFGDTHFHINPIGPTEDWLKKEVELLSDTDKKVAPTPQEEFNADVREVIEEIASLLEEKNRKYGDSALNPSRTFARSDAVEQIKVRLDDKLTRIKNSQNDEDEDVVKDLIGYLIILRIAQKRAS